MKITPISPRCKSSRWISRYGFIARRAACKRASHVVVIETYADIKKTNTRDGATISIVYWENFWPWRVRSVSVLLARERARKRRDGLRRESPLLDPFTIMHPHVTWPFAWRSDFSARPRISDGPPRIIERRRRCAERNSSYANKAITPVFFLFVSHKSRLVWLLFPFLASASYSLRAYRVSTFSISFESYFRWLKRYTSQFSLSNDIYRSLKKSNHKRL